MSVLATADLFPPPPPPYPTLTLTCYQLTIVGLGEGYVRSCLGTDIDPSVQYFFIMLFSFILLKCVLFAMFFGRHISFFFRSCIRGEC